MTEFLDIMFSNITIMTLFILVQLFFFIWLASKYPFKSPGLNKVYKVLMFIVPCFIMVSPYMLYYGKTNDFKKMTIGTNYICLLEQYERGGESGDETVCRLHFLDKITGEKLDRKYIGHNSELIGMKNDLVCFSYNDELNMLDIKNEKTIYSIGIDDWKAEFNELHSGIEEITFAQNFNEPREAIIRITGKDGNSYWFEPFAKKLMVSEPKNQNYTGYYSTGYEIKHLNSEGEIKYPFGFVYLGNSKRKKIKAAINENESKITESNLTFLEPKFLGIDDKNKLFIFTHFANTDKTDFTIEAMTYEMKSIWKKKKAELEVEDAYSNEFSFDVYTIENGILYFNIGGFVLAMDTKTGKIIWKTRN
jgi:hypothetical protein